MKRWQPRGPIDLGPPDKAKKRGARFNVPRVKKIVRGELRSVDSAGERDRGIELESEERARQIEGLERQVVFGLDVVRRDWVDELVTAALELAGDRNSKAAVAVRALVSRLDSGEALVHVANYRADYVYRRRGRIQRTVEDFKNRIETEVFRMKSRLMIAAHGIEVHVSGPKWNPKLQPRKPKRLR